MKKLMNIFIVFIFWLAHAPSSLAAETGFQIIVHSTNPITEIDQRLLTEIFLKKKNYWTDSRPIAVVDLISTSSVRRQFSEKALNRPVSAVRNYWQQLIFSGRGVPPPELNEQDVLKFVSANEDAIGYVSADTDIGSLKAVKIK